VTSPALLFSLLSGTTLDPERLAALGLGTVAIVVGTALLAILYVRASGVGRGFLLPALFWNGGNMGLACSRLAFGPAGLESAAIPFVTIALLNSLFGIWIAKGENGLAEALRLPLLYGAAGGLVFAITGVELPAMVMEPIRMLGAMAIPLMLLNLGLQLRTLVVSDVAHSGVAVAVRMGGGFACAWGFVQLAGVSGVDRGVLLLMGVMPPAVINAVIAQRYDTDPSLVASSIVLGTLASLATIPLVLLIV
jgi:predicted permease